MGPSDLESRDGRVLALLPGENTEEEASTIRLDVCTSRDYLGGSRRKSSYRLLLRPGICHNQLSTEAVFTIKGNLIYKLYLMKEKHPAAKAANIWQMAPLKAFHRMSVSSKAAIPLMLLLRAKLPGGGHQSRPRQPEVTHAALEKGQDLMLQRVEALRCAAIFSITSGHPEVVRHLDEMIIVGPFQLDYLFYAHVFLYSSAGLGVCHILELSGIHQSDTSSCEDLKKSKRGFE
ncbi:uncharacterized protein LOC133277980 [Pezoporus flaviventris]|uniref:uncharacterized protein LOC133277980 n=1 Tax=Pezoporus flaviventris TaxID=889875 RepID=UPI002AAFF2FF|nr:uncharacterized protein LOC133277980 [Pezoporus flaviventris]